MRHVTPLRMDKPTIVFERTSWHPLDHRIGSARCKAYQFSNWASYRTHARYWWDFKRDDDWSLFYRLTLCWWGHHKMRRWYTRAHPGEVRESCAWCTHTTGWRPRREDEPPPLIERWLGKE